MVLESFGTIEMTKISSFKNKIPLPIRLFIGKAFLVFVIWKIVYGLFLYDSPLIYQILTKHVGESSVLVLNNLGNLSGFTSETEEWDSFTDGKLKTQVAAIYHFDNKVLYIADACNGLSLMVLYIGFVICMPSKFSRKLKYILIGLIIIDAFNILRCVGLIYVYEYFNHYFDFAHHHLFKAIVYALTFLMMTVYARKISLKHETV